jgi:hypothetical protein
MDDCFYSIWEKWMKSRSNLLDAISVLENDYSTTSSTELRDRLFQRGLHKDLVAALATNHIMAAEVLIGWGFKRTYSLLHPCQRIDPRHVKYNGPMLDFDEAQSAGTFYIQKLDFFMEIENDDHLLRKFKHLCMFESELRSQHAPIYCLTDGQLCELRSRWNRSYARLLAQIAADKTRGLRLVLWEGLGYARFY